MPLKHYNVVIAGGAAVGSAAAYFLTSRPDFNGSVLIVEKDPSYQNCATARSAASIRHQFSTPENIRMSQFGTEFLRNFDTLMGVDGQPPDPAFVEGGYLFLATEAGLAVLTENHKTQTALGANIVLLDPEALSLRFPWLQTRDLAGASFGLSGEGWLDAYGMMQGMRRKAIANGAHYVHDTVMGALREGRRIRHITLEKNEPITCDYLINAAGIGAKALARSAGIELPIESRKRSVFYVHCPSTLPSCPMVIDPSGAYFRPEGKGFIMGIAPPPDQDPECIDVEVQHALFDDMLWPTLAERVPAFEALRVQRSWAGHYDMNTIDHNLILGPHPDVDNLLFANGLSGHGMQQAPAIGRALSELIIDGGYRSLDLSRMGWERILENRPIIEKNVV